MNLKKAPIRINREGVVWFSDASFGVRENGTGSRAGRPTYQEQNAWEKQFKRDVFSRIVQQLNRMGWTCKIPQEYIDQYGLSFARDRRECEKGDLKGWLDLSGFHIKFEMWQGVNTPTRPDHGGRYESNKEKVMPYLLRIRMERTRRRIAQYLCNIFERYSLEDRSPKSQRAGPGSKSALALVLGEMKKSSHYQPELGRASFGMDRNNLSGDKQRLDNGMRVYAKDWCGRMVCGTAYYQLNDRWYVVLGKYDYTCVNAHDAYVESPGDLNIKRNERQRRNRLESELAKAIKAMDFIRANTLKGILFPAKEQVFVVRHPDGLYHRSNFCGYTNNLVDAGKFTAKEASRYAQDNTVIPLEKAS